MDSNEQKWYENVANSEERNKFYEIFFSACNTYNIKWATATPMEKLFIETYANFTFAKWKSKNSQGTVVVQPIFSI